MSSLPGELLWQRLREAGIAQGDLPDAEPGAPWFVRLMLGIAGWIGALFLFGFFGVALQELLRSAGARLFLGALLCAAAALVLRAVRHGELLGQFGFALSLAGQGLLASGFGEALRGSAAAAAALAVQQAILFLAVPGMAHRAWCALSGGYALGFALGAWGLAPFASPLLFAAFALAGMSELRHARQAPLLRAAAYGLGLAAFVSSVMDAAWMDALWFRHSASPGNAQAWTGAIAGGAVLVASAGALLRRDGVPLGSAPGALAMAGALIVAAAAAKAPGIAPATGLLVLGYANGNRVLGGLGIVALTGYLSYYYYSLHATLLDKSALLAATGIALLAARFVMQRVVPGKAARDA